MSKYAHPQAEGFTNLEAEVLKPRGFAMKQSTLNVMTIGYEGAVLDDFLRTLKHAQVTLLLDVREIALSRRKGFSKTALSEALAAAGIDYRHERMLGSPKEVRHQLREDGDYQRYFRDFREYLATQRKLLDSLAK